MGIIVGSVQPSAALDAQDHYIRGNEYLYNHQYSEAILEYKSALKLNPYYKSAYLNLGKAYQAKRLFKDATASYKKAISLDENYVEAYINLARCYELQNLLSRAKINLEKAIRLDPVNPEAHFYLANVLYKNNKIKNSIEEYLQTTKIDPTYFQAYLKLGSIYLKDFEDDKNAIYYFNLAKKTNPRNETSYLKLGELYFQKGLFNKAISEYKKAVELNPTNPVALTKYGLLYLTIGEYKNALPIFKKLIELTPANSLAHYTLGVIYEKSGMFDDALNEFETTLSLDTNDEVALFREEQIILEFNRLPVDSPLRKKDSEKHLISAENYLQEGFLTLATFEFKKSILLDPQNPNTRLALAKLYELIGRKQLAIDELIKVVELTPTNLEAKDRLERLYFEDETSLVKKEKIDQIPVSEIDLVVCAYPSNPIHFEMEEITLKILRSILNQFPHITLTEGGLILNDEKEIIDVGRKLKAEFALALKINETEQRIDINAELIDLKTVKKILKTQLPVRGKDKLIKALTFLAEKVINTIPTQGVIMRLADDKVIINLGKIHGLKPDQILEVWKREGELDPFTQRIKKPESIGKIKVVAVEPEISKALIITPMTLKFIGINDVVKLP
ncbi:MAG: tetratricopeptide repeat protein [bacterium]